MIKGHLKIIVMKNLKEGEHSGYDLCKHIEEETGYKPSFGSIYPLLNDLHDKRLVEVKKSGRKKIYSLTKKGKETLEGLNKSKEEIMGTMQKNIKIMEFMCDEEDKKLFGLSMKMMQNPVVIAGIEKELQELRILFLSMVQKGLIKRNENGIKIILKKTIRELKKLE